MKKLILINILFFACLKVLPLKMFYYYSIFYDDNLTPYAEFNFFFNPKNLKFKKIDNGYRNYVLLKISFYIKDTLKKKSETYINSPIWSDTTQLNLFFFSEKYYLEPNQYVVIIEAIDTINPKNQKVFLDSLKIPHPTEKNILISDILPIEKYFLTEKSKYYSKNDYEIIPYYSNFYPKEIKNLTLYFEIYNTEKVLGKDKKFALKYYIQKAYSNQILEKYHSVRITNTDKIICLFIKFDISQLATGTYNFIIECISEENKILAQKNFLFYRENEIIKNDKLVNLADYNSYLYEKFNNKDSLKNYLKCMLPISKSIETTTINKAIKSNNLKTMQDVFISFWQKRNPLNPEKEWEKYYESVKYVNNVYGYSKVLGCLTDRGRVYLKYGPPDQIIESKHEPSAYPYEIWHYYIIDNQRNKKFVFYNPTLAYKEYILLHSDVKGEIQDKNWERRLHSRNNSMYNFDATESDEQFGSRAKELYRK